MSFSSQDMRHQIKHISKTVAQVPEASVAQVSNKKLIARCADKFIAKSLAFTLNNDGFAVEVRRGIKSSAYYVAAFYNAPF